MSTFIQQNICPNWSQVVLLALIRKVVYQQRTIHTEFQTTQGKGSAHLWLSFEASMMKAEHKLRNTVVHMYIYFHNSYKNWLSLCFSKLYSPKGCMYTSCTSSKRTFSNCLKNKLNILEFYFGNNYSYLIYRNAHLHSVTVQLDATLFSWMFATFCKIQKYNICIEKYYFCWCINTSYRSGKRDFHK